MKPHLLLEFALTSGILAVVLWRWFSLLPGVWEAVAGVGAAMIERERVMDDIQREISPEPK